MVAGGGDVPAPESTPISEQELRVLAMRLLQEAVTSEMRFFIEQGRFTDDPQLLGSRIIVPGGGASRTAGTVTVEPPTSPRGYYVSRAGLQREGG